MADNELYYVFLADSNGVRMTSYNKEELLEYLQDNSAGVGTPMDRYELHSFLHAQGGGDPLEWPFDDDKEGVILIIKGVAITPRPEKDLTLVLWTLLCVKPG